ncbi:MAG: hypothetical protein ACLUVC_13190 [Longibaculum sp.]
MSNINHDVDNIYIENVLMQFEDVVDSLTLVSSYTDERSNFAEIHGIIEVIKRDCLNLQVKISELFIQDNHVKEIKENE